MEDTSSGLTESNGVRKLMDTLVAGYLGRHKYWETLKCFMNESPILRTAQCGSGTSIILGDTVHGKYLEEIIILFTEYGNFGVTPALLDFGLRLRSLANEFTSLTNASAHWSDAQKILYGKHVPPSALRQQQRMLSQERLNDESVTVQTAVHTAEHTDSVTSICSQHNNGSASTRRKCTQPVSINTRRREFLKEVVEPVVHTAQQIIDGNGNGNTSDPTSSSLSAVSLITIDENAVGMLDRCMAHENFAELIESFERDFPEGFFDSLPNSDNMDNLHGSVFDAVPSQSGDVVVQQDHEPKSDDSQNLYNIPQADEVTETRPLCFSTPKNITRDVTSVVHNMPEASTSSIKPKHSRSQSKSARKKSVVAESAIFKERVELKCPYLPSVGARNPQADVPMQNVFVGGENSAEETKSGKPEISAGWRRLAKICGESCGKITESVEERRTVPNKENPEKYQTVSQLPANNESTSEVFTCTANLEVKREIQSEIRTAPQINDDKTTVSNNSINVISQQPEKCTSDKGGTTECSKRISRSIEREIDLLFENSDEEDSRNSQDSKGCIVKTTDANLRAAAATAAVRAVPVVDTENGKCLAERSGTFAEASPFLGPNSSERPDYGRKSIPEKKKKKQKIRKTGSVDFAGDSRNLIPKKKQPDELHVSRSPIRDSERQCDASATGNSPLCKASEQHKKTEKVKKLEENKEEARTIAERRKKEKEFLIKREREEIERQKREVEEKEIRRAAERERRRMEEEQREAREREERERRRREREDRDRLRKIKEKEEKLRCNDDLRKQQQRERERERSKDGKLKKEPESYKDELGEAYILDTLLGDGDGTKSTAKIPDKDEQQRKRSSSVQKSAVKVKLSKEDYRARREKREREADSARATKTTWDNSSNQPDALDDLLNCLASKPCTSRKDDLDIVEPKSYKKVVVSGVNKGRENLLVGGGHSARVGMVLEKATRIRTKYEHDEKVKQEYNRKLETIRRSTPPVPTHNARKRILDLPIPKTPELLSQVLKPDVLSSSGDALRRSISAKNITNSIEANASNSPVASKSFTFASDQKSLHYEASLIGSQIKRPRLDMAAIDKVLQNLHGSNSSSPSSSSSSRSLSVSSIPVAPEQKSSVPVTEQKSP